MQEQPTTPVQKQSVWQRMMRRKWWFVAGLILCLGMLGVVFAQRDSDVEYVTAAVERGVLIQTVEATGELSPLNDVDIAFEASGPVSAIAASVGDQVLAGDVIATVTSADALADLARAQEAVNLAQANIDQVLAGSTDEDVAAAQATYDAAAISYENAVTQGESSVTSARIAMEAAQDDLAQTREDNEEDLSQVYQDLRSVLRDSVIDVRSVLADADEILGVEQTSANSDFENILAASNPQALTDAVRAYEDAAEARDDVEAVVYALTSSTEQSVVDSAADEVAEALELTATTLYHTRRVLDATFSNSANLSQTEINTFKTTIDAARATIQTQEDALQSQRQLIATTELSAAALEQDALNAYETALQSYNAAQVNRDASVASAQATLSLREAELAKVVADARSVDLAPLYAQLGQAQADLQASQARLAKTELRAPIDGVVTAIDVDAGEFATTGVAVVTVQSTSLDAYQVTIQVPESDIAKVEVGQSADMTFDAFGDDITVDGTVLRIDPAEQTVEGVVYYEVDVAIDEAIAGMKSGMSADVTILTNQKENALSIPQRAILVNDGLPYVRVRTGSGYQERSVETGLRADGGRVEVLSGLEEGEEIILSIRE